MLRRIVLAVLLTCGAGLLLWCVFALRDAQVHDDTPPPYVSLEIDDNGDHPSCPAGYDRPEFSGGYIVCTRKDLKETF